MTNRAAGAGARDPAPSPALVLPPGVRVAREADVDVLSRVLARSFHDDPTHRWFFRSESAWRRHSHRTFAILMRHNLAEGTVLTTDDRSGAAIWASPDTHPPGALDQLRMALRMLPHFAPRMRRALLAFRAIEAAQPRERHWYLGVLGADPDRQGRGVGRALLDPVLARADADWISVWLEASRIENVPFYRRFGFEVTWEIPLPGGPTVYGMSRKPRR